MLLTSGPARTHVVVGARSLHLRVARAELVVHVRIVDPRVLLRSPGSGAGEARGPGALVEPLVEAEVLEALKGKPPSPRLRIAQHGHEVARYRAGDEAILFLEPIAEHRELAMLAAVQGGPSHVSTQEHDEAYRVEPPHGATLLSATRDLVVAGSAGAAAARREAVHRATLDLLLTGDAALGSVALASLVAAPDVPLVTAADLPRLEGLLADPDVSVGLRAGLLAELERRGLVEGPGRWVALMRGARPEDRPAAIRAAGAHPSPAVRGHLLGLLQADDPVVAAEAAMALGASRRSEVVEALAEVLAQGAPRLRRAAIRALGASPAPAARAALERAAREHPDPATRRLAGAEARVAAARDRDAGRRGLRASD